jgi:hypothetical protein
VVWVEQNLLPREPLSQTGDRLQLPGGSGGRSGPVRSGNRLVLVPRSETHSNGVLPGSVVRTGSMSAALDNSWVLLVTGTYARPRDKPVFFAAGRLGAGARRAEILKDGAWDRYQKTVAGLRT